MKSRIISGVLAAAYVILAYNVTGDAYDTVKFAFCLLLPLACIWYSDALGEFTGGFGGRAITATTPGCFVAFIGWLLLLLPLVIGLILAIRG